MKFLRAFLEKLKQKNSGLERDTVILWGIALLLLLFMALLFWDGYIFYAAAVRERVAPTPIPTAMFSQKEIDDIIVILDDREKKLNELLGRKNISGGSQEVTAAQK